MLRQTHAEGEGTTYEPLPADPFDRKVEHVLSKPGEETHHTTPLFAVMRREGEGEVR